MPIYLYRNPKTDVIIEVVQSIHDKHEYIDNDGLIYDREYTIPTTSVDTKINPFDSKAFVENSKTKSGTIGNLQDLSKELSEKRSQILGTDPIKEKRYQEYSELRLGKQHLQQKKEKLKEVLKNNKHFELA
jgi:hypothetical protein